jgi:molecular chaperone DnaJ
VPFETAAFGGKTTVRVQRNEACGVCSGSGAEAGGKAETCPSCGGSGTASHGQGGFSFSRPCPQCLGRGQVVTKPCKACRGTGRKTGPRDLEVKIPSGVADGTVIRLRGEGEAGERGGPSGDLLLTIHTTGHRSFKRKGLDIESEIRIGVVDAVLGVTLEVATLTGKVDLRIPAGIQPGAKLRLKGRGVKDHRERQGDHFVIVRIEIPKKLSDEEREIYEQLRKECGGEC